MKKELLIHNRSLCYHPSTSQRLWRPRMRRPSKQMSTVRVSTYRLTKGHLRTRTARLK